MFHGYDEDYERDDILQHINMLDDPKRKRGEQTLNWLLNPHNDDDRDEDGNAWTADTFFSHYVPKVLINSRKILLGGLREGLTLGMDPDDILENGCGVSSVFSQMPLEAIQRIYFARPGISIEDLLGRENGEGGVICPKFGEGGECFYGCNCVY